MQYKAVDADDYISQKIETAMAKIKVHGGRMNEMQMKVAQTV